MRILKDFNLERLFVSMKFQMFLRIVDGINCDIEMMISCVVKSYSLSARFSTGLTFRSFYPVSFRKPSFRVYAKKQSPKKKIRNNPLPEIIEVTEFDEDEKTDISNSTETDETAKEDVDEAVVDLLEETTTEREAEAIAEETIAEAKSQTDSFEEPTTNAKSLVVSKPPPTPSRFLSSMNWTMIGIGSGVAAAIVGAILVARSFASGPSGQTKFLDKLQKVVRLWINLSEETSFRVWNIGNSKKKQKIV